MSKTIFEKIIDKEIPSNVVYEDNNFIAILDVNPKQKGHTLVIPKKKEENLLEENSNSQMELMKIVIMLSKKIKKNLDATGIKLITNIGKSSGQEVFHTHIHIVPYYEKKTLPINNEKVLKEILIK